MQRKQSLLDALAIMRDLRQRCEWDAAQTHASLRPYLIEEAFEPDWLAAHPAVWVDAYAGPPVDLPADGEPRVSQGPARHDEVVREDQEGGAEGEPAQPQLQQPTLLG